LACAELSTTTIRTRASAGAACARALASARRKLAGRFSVGMMIETTSIFGPRSGQAFPVETES
jgi:hypothetical protein